MYRHLAPYRSILIVSGEAIRNVVHVDGFADAFFEAIWILLARGALNVIPRTIRVVLVPSYDAELGVWVGRLAGLCLFAWSHVD